GSTAFDFLDAECYPTLVRVTCVDRVRSTVCGGANGAPRNVHPDNRRPSEELEEDAEVAAQGLLRKRSHRDISVPCHALSGSPRHANSPRRIEFEDALSFVVPDELARPCSLQGCPPSVGK